MFQSYVPPCAPPVAILPVQTHGLAVPVSNPGLVMETTTWPAAVTVRTVEARRDWLRPVHVTAVVPGVPAVYAPVVQLAVGPVAKPAVTAFVDWSPTRASCSPVMVVPSAAYVVCTLPTVAPFATTLL